MKKQFTLVLALVSLGALLTSVAFAGTLSGYVYDVDGNPLQGVTITEFKGSNTSTTTDQYGYYSIALPFNSPGFLVEKDGYISPVRWQEDKYSYESDTQDWKLTPMDSAQIWTGFDGSALSGGWMGNNVTVSGSAAHLAAGGELELQSGFAQSYVDMTTVFKANTGFSWVAIGARENVTGAAGPYFDGQTVFINPNGAISLSWYSGATGNGGTFRDATTVDWSVDHTVRVLVNGYRTTVWFDGALAGSLISANTSPELPKLGWTGENDESYWNTTLRSGTVGIYSFGQTLDVKSVSIGGAVPEPGSLVAIFTGMVGLVGFARRRRA